MASLRYILMVATVGLAQSKPIMVTFGTNTGPIVPAQPISSTVAPNAPKTPAPVYENVDDVPNPHPYKPLSPHQYRNKIYAFKPHPNLILGTPIDQKYEYNPSLEKHNYYKKMKLAKALGFEYRGPALFDKQTYEIEREKYKALQYKEKQQDNQQKRYDQSPSATQYQDQPMRTQNSYIQQANTQLVPYNQQYPVQNNYQYTTTQSPNNYQTTARQVNRRNDNEQQRPQRYTQTSIQTQPGNYENYQYQYDNQNVPQIGIAHSSGLKYYVPQGLGYYQEGENAVQHQPTNQQYYN